MATPWKDEDLQRVCCREVTTVKLWSSEEQHLGDRLDLVQNDETFQAKLPALVSVMYPYQGGHVGAEHLHVVT